MTKVLLISEDFVKTNSQLNDNYFGKWLLPAIREAQDMNLQLVLGSCLYNKILDLVKTGEIKEEINAAYKDLLENYIQIYLMYQVLSETVVIPNAKLANIGTVVTQDERIVNLSQSEIDLLEHRFEFKADFYCKRLQEFLLNNKDAFAELDCCTCERIKANLKSSSNCDIWLGGIYYEN